MKATSTADSDFQTFLNQFIPAVEKKQNLLCKASWVLETTGSTDAADILASLDTELSVIFSDHSVYERLLVWKKGGIKDPLLSRQLDVLIRSFKGNMLPEKLLSELSQKSAELSQKYATYRPELNGAEVTENDLLNILKFEKDVEKRKIAWNVTKNIGNILAPAILDLVNLRNQSAKILGYKNYFEMSLDLQEIDMNWLMKFLDEMYERTTVSYDSLISDLDNKLSVKFKVHSDKIGPWAWSDPFCQEDPLAVVEIDELVKDRDAVDTANRFYNSIGISLESVTAKSDLYERPGKNQHAFCESFDRKGDVRVLANVRPTIRWFDTMLHEFGHAVYDLGIDKSLPWLLRTPPHMIPTEAMALIAGRQAYKPEFVKEMVDPSPKAAKIANEAWISQSRRQLIFSRWVQVIVRFEKEMYANPSQDLNSLWWGLVNKYQRVNVDNRSGKNDWAAKYHVGLAPVYYHSYLIGEVFASMMTEHIKDITGSSSMVGYKDVGKFLTNNLFKPGDKMPWNELIKYCVGKDLSIDSWLNEFTKLESVN